MMLNGNSGYGNSYANSTTGTDKPMPHPLGALIAWKPVIVWRPGAGRA